MKSFRLNIVPPTTTAQQKKIRIIQKGGKHMPMMYDPKSVVEAKEKLKGHLLEHVPPSPLMGPLAVEIDWVWPWRKSELKGRINAYDRFPCDNRPDIDNLCKAFFDCMTNTGFWGDDSQIYDLRFRKWWGDKPGIEVKIIHGDELPDGPVTKQQNLIKI